MSAFGPKADIANLCPSAWFQQLTACLWHTRLCAKDDHERLAA
jgi:hypothetical protein